MFTLPAINWALTAVLLLGAAHSLGKAARTGPATDRINNTLHALMHLAMAAMLWNLAPATVLAQTGLLAAAALWFTIQAIARPEFTLLCTGTTGRITCAYHALTMTAAALMTALMAPPINNTATTGMTMPMTHPHHHTTAAPGTGTGTMTPGTMTPGPALAILMTVLFSTAAVVFIVLLIRRQATHTTRHATHHPPSHKHPTRTDHGLQALGATAMALMSATMTA